MTASAYSQARPGLKYTALIELNRQAVAKGCYQDGDSVRYQGVRLLAIDGSKVRLPDTKDLTAEFGQSRDRNKNPDVDGVHPWGLASVLQDGLNDVALDASVGAANAYEVNLAVAPLAQPPPGDLIVTDRTYPSYRFLAAMAQAGRDFVSRCSANSLRTARALRRGEGADRPIVTLKADAHHRHGIRERGLPRTLKVRFVRLTLGPGEYEVLITALLDQARYPTALFLELYGLRWGVEGVQGRRKPRLGLENFTGHSAESVRQDVHATLYLTGWETLLTVAANARLAAKNTPPTYQVNPAGSFNAIKTRALDLLDQKPALERLREPLTALFLTNPTCVRAEPKVPRRHRSLRPRLDYHQRRTKACFQA